MIYKLLKASGAQYGSYQWGDFREEQIPRLAHKSRGKGDHGCWVSSVTRPNPIGRECAARISKLILIGLEFYFPFGGKQIRKCYMPHARRIASRRPLLVPRPNNGGSHGRRRRNDLYSRQLAAQSACIPRATTAKCSTIFPFSFFLSFFFSF